MPIVSVYVKETLLISSLTLCLPARRGQSDRWLIVGDGEWKLRRSPLGLSLSIALNEERQRATPSTNQLKLRSDGIVSRSN